MAICVAGMHRSGTSMIGRILHALGVHLGRESDLMPPSAANPGGYWENVRFVELNDEILGALGGSWDAPPPLTDDWHDRDELTPLRKRAAALLSELVEHEPVGWKDPRNSLTIRLWRAVCSDLRVVVCLRDPRDVAASLAARESRSQEASVRLWVAYNQELANSLEPAERLVTHYDTYFVDPEAEIHRLAEALELPAGPADVERAVAAVDADHRHAHRVSQDSLPGEVAGLYESLCAEAGPHLEEALRRRGTFESTPVASIAGARERELRELLLESHEQLLRREDALEAARHELEARDVEIEARDAEIEWRKQVAEQREEELGWLRTALATTEEHLSAIMSSRSWRLLRSFRGMKRRVGL